MAKLISVAEAARRLGITEQLVRRYCRQGRIAAECIGSVWVLDFDEVERFARIERQVGRPKKGGDAC